MALPDPLSVNPQVFTPFTQQLTAQAGSIAKDKANKRLTAQKALQDFSNIENTGWYKHDNEINAKIADLRNTTAKILQSGIDLSDTRNPAVQKYLTDLAAQKGNIQRDTKYSLQMKDEYAKDQQLLETSKASGIEFEPEGIADLVKYHDATIDDRVSGKVKRPVLVPKEKRLDLTKYVDDRLKSEMGFIKQGNTWYTPTADGGLEVVKEIDYPIEKLRRASQSIFLEPAVQKEIVQRFEETPLYKDQYGNTTDYFNKSFIDWRAGTQTSKTKKLPSGYSSGSGYLQTDDVRIQKSEEPQNYYFSNQTTAKNLGVNTQQVDLGTGKSLGVENGNLYVGEGKKTSYYTVKLLGTSEEKFPIDRAFSSTNIKGTKNAVIGDPVDVTNVNIEPNDIEGVIDAGGVRMLKARVYVKERNEDDKYEEVAKDIVVPLTDKLIGRISAHSKKRKLTKEEIYKILEIEQGTLEKQEITPHAKDDTKKDGAGNTEKDRNKGKRGTFNPVTGEIEYK